LSQILIIDDDVILLASLGLMLEDAGFSVAKSSDLINAERIYKLYRPDLVLLEVRSERDRGWDLLSRLAVSTPVIVLSAASREEDVVRGFAVGAVDYIAKPYRSSELLVRIRTRIAMTVPSLAPEPTVPALAPELTVPALAPELPEPPELPHPPEPPELPHPPEPPELPHLSRLSADLSSSNTDSLQPPQPTRRAPTRREIEEEPVFMSEAEEMALLRIPSTSSSSITVVEPPALDEHASLGPRLRNERLRRHLTLVQVENELKIRMSYLQAIEDEKYTLIPRGPVALQMMRSYVTFLGIDPEPVIEAFRTQHYVEQYEPLPALGGPRIPRSLPTWVIWTAAVALAFIVTVSSILLFDPGFFMNLWVQIFGLLAV
jgi:CheY-like chemotaxis protein